MKNGGKDEINKEYVQSRVKKEQRRGDREDGVELVDARDERF